MKNILKYSVLGCCAAWLLGSCATTGSVASRSAVYDDLYGTHDRSSIALAQQARAEQQQAAREAAALMDIQNAGVDGYYNENILSTSYQESYERRLRGFNSLTYRLPSSYYEFAYSDAAGMASVYDPTYYNVIVMGDEVWVEPRYITAMFGNWGTSVNINFSWGRGTWYTPYWYWGYYDPYWSVTWGWRPLSHSWYYGHHSWGPGWGWGWGWGYPHYGWGGPHGGWNRPWYGGGSGGNRPGRYDNVVYGGRRPSSTGSSVVNGGNSVNSTGTVDGTRRRTSTTSNVGSSSGDRIYYNNNGTTQSGATYQRRGTATTGTGTSTPTYNNSGNTSSGTTYDRRNSGSTTNSTGTPTNSNSNTNSNNPTYQRRSTTTTPTTPTPTRSTPTYSAPARSTAPSSSGSSGGSSSGGSSGSSGTRRR